jgi:hypothetical protein
LQAVASRDVILHSFFFLHIYLPGWYAYQDRTHLTFFRTSVFRRGSPLAIFIDGLTSDCDY